MNCNLTFCKQYQLEPYLSLGSATKIMMNEQKNLEIQWFHIDALNLKQRCQ